MFIFILYHMKNPTKMEYLLQLLGQGTATSNSFLLCLLFLLFLLVLLRLKSPASTTTTKYKFPPSPSRLPFIGNMHQIFHGSLHHALYSLSQKHGPLMSIHLLSKPALVVSSADAARTVLKTYDHVFSSRPQLAIPSRLLYGKDIAFAPHGEYWRQVRKICVLELLSAKKVQSFRGVREEEVALLMDEIEAASTAVNLSEMFVTLTNNIVCKVALGRKFGAEEGGGWKFKNILNEFTYLLGVSNIEDLVPSLGWVNKINGLKARVEKNFRDIDYFLNGVIEEHLEKMKKGIKGGDEEMDMVDIMLMNEENSTLGIPLTREGIKAILMDMFAAGTDTTSVVLEWAMSELLKNPKIMVETQKEVRDFSKGKHILHENDINEMHMLKSVIKETLRLHPPLPLLIFRESIKDVQLADYYIPAKTTIMINAFAIGRDPMWWDEPNKFFPKRFLNDNNTLVDYKGQDYQLIPFGAGRRGCPGIQFATSVMELTLANLLHKFDWTMPNGIVGDELDMCEGSGITIHRKTDLVLLANLYY